MQTKQFQLPKTANGRRALKNKYARFNLIEIEDVEKFVMTALLTLDAQPGVGLVVHSGWPQALADEADEGENTERREKYKATPYEISNYIDWLAWLNPLPEDQKNIITWRAFRYSFRQIAGKIGKSDTDAANKFKDAISNAWLAASWSKHQEADEKNRQRQRASGNYHRRTG